MDSDEALGDRLPDLRERDVLEVADGGRRGGAARAAAAAAGAAATADSMSRLMIRPPGPEPCTCEIESAIARPSRRASGDERTGPPLPAALGAGGGSRRCGGGGGAAGAAGAAGAGGACDRGCRR